MKPYAILAGLVAIAAVPHASLLAADFQGPRLSSPVLGYAFDDSAKAIRTISGVPGAASWGPAVELADTLTAAWVHSQARVAIGIDKSGAAVAVAWSGTVQSLPLTSALDTLQQVAFSRSGVYAVLSDGSGIEVWTQLTGTPRLAWSAAAVATSLAVDDAGSVAAGLKDGSLVRLTGAESRTLSTAGDWKAVTLTADGKVAAADATLGQVALITDDGGFTVLGSFTGSALALAASPSGDQIAVLEDGSISIFAAGSVSHIGLDVDPKAQGLQLLAGDFVVFLQGAGRTVDTATGELRLTTIQNQTGIQGGSAQ
ncbi:MAG: hypothetical protein WDO18_07560 [Acidobacteriota bacterium]